MKIKKVYFVGIKGVGQTPLAIIAKEAGWQVSGSDIDEEFITDEPLRKAGIKSLVGFSKDNIKDYDLVVTTGAHGGFDNIEVKEAKRKNIKVITKGEALGLFMKGEIIGSTFDGISVAGSHGKTTVAALIATILKNVKLDPSFLVGTGNIPSLGAPGHYGRGRYFVAEADEYATEPKYDKTPQFLWQFPKIAVFTNIELDHPDMFSTVDDVRVAFLKFAQNLSKNSTLVCFGDDPQIQLLLKQFKNGRVITYGYSSNNDYTLEEVRISGTQTFFWAKAKDISLGEFSLRVPGEHNALNALGSLVVALEVGLSVDTIRRALRQFQGTKRRFEYVGKLKNGVLAYDDYAHHPTEIQKTLRAFKQSFPKHKIVCIFQPHTYSRTKKLFEQFSSSFNDADTVILTNIFPSSRETEDPTVSSGLLAAEMSKTRSQVVFLPKLKDVIEYVENQEFNSHTIVLTMGAGDVYKIWKSLL